MKIFASSQVREIDSFTIAEEPIVSIDLMERAAKQLHSWYTKNFHTDRRVCIFAGPGNNGGDALALARLLTQSNYEVETFLLDFGKRSADCTKNMDRLQGLDGSVLQVLGENDPLPVPDEDTILMDGIFGSGLSRSASGFSARVIAHLNALSNRVVAIDIPSGLFGEDNSANAADAIIRADHTLSFQFPFLSFFFAENAAFVGEWEVLDIRLHPGIIDRLQAGYKTIEGRRVAASLPKRGRFAHKGSFGHALLIAGSHDMMGAALLAGEACLRGGAGLCTLHVPRSARCTVQGALPEALLSLDQSEILFSDPPLLEAFSAVGAGPALGCKPNTSKGLRALLEKVKVPLVLDADALNILAAEPELMELLPSGSILTPHPGEFDRLAGPSANGWVRHLKQKEMALKYRVIIILKGGCTGISAPEGSYWLNTTGNPGMATGGSGDVLTGLLTGLLAQGMQPLDAALAAVFIHGMAGDLAMEELGQEALIAGDLVRKLGPAFLKTRTYTNFASNN